MSNIPNPFTQTCGTCNHSEVINNKLWCEMFRDEMLDTQWCPKWERMSASWTEAE